MNHFKHSPLDCSNTENAAMSIFCAPCLYGINKSKFDTLNGEVSSSMMPGTFTYIFILLGWQVMGVLYTGLIANLFHTVPSPEVVQAVSSLCGSVGTGIYAGKLRSKIRSKYNIEGTRFMDFMMHSFASPCALCQEANEIKWQSTNNEQSYMPVYTAK